MPKTPKTQRVFELCSRASQNICQSGCNSVYMSFQSALLHIKRERGASADAARHCALELRPHGCQTDKQASQKFREGSCPTFQSRARLYIDAVCMAKPRRRDVTGKENNWTSMNRQKCDARSCSSSVRPRGDRFSACRLIGNVMHVSYVLHTTLRGSSREGAALGSN